QRHLTQRIAAVEEEAAVRPEGARDLLESLLFEAGMPPVEHADPHRGCEAERLFPRLELEFLDGDLAQTQPARLDLRCARSAGQRYRPGRPIDGEDVAALEPSGD